MPAATTPPSARLIVLGMPLLVLLAAFAGIQLGSLSSPEVEKEAVAPKPLTPLAERPRSASPAPLSRRADTPVSASFSPSNATTPAMASTPPSRLSTAAQEQRHQDFLTRSRSQTPAAEEPVDPYLPGHSISANGQRVFIESYQMQPANGHNALNVAIVPEPEIATQADSTPASPQIQSRLDSSISLSRNPRLGVGFTDEELAFRAKWGWAAHDAALRAAFEEANRQALPSPR